MPAGARGPGFCWRQSESGTTLTRFYYSVIADDNGKFKVNWSGSGKYKIFALEKIVTGSFRNPESAELLDALKDQAKKWKSRGREGGGASQAGSGGKGQGDSQAMKAACLLMAVTAAAQTRGSDGQRQRRGYDAVTHMAMKKAHGGHHADGNSADR